MKLSLTQENLAKALSAVGRIVTTRASLPILSNILLSTDGSRLRLSATNLELGINCWIGSKVIEEGEVAVPSRLFTDYVNSLPGGTLDLTTIGESLQISSPHYDSKINGFSSEEFPIIPQITSKPVLIIQAGLLKEALSQVIVAASLDEARPVLAGIYLYTEDELLFIAATDSYRLAEKRVAIPENQRELKVIIPVRTIQELLRLLGDHDDVELYLDESQVMFKYGEIELVSRLIEGQFPPYRQIVPESAVTSFDISTAEFGRLVKVASLFAREGSGSLKLDIREDGEISLVAKDSEIGGNKSSAECDVSGADNEVSLNARYLQDALSVIKSPQTRFSMTDKLSACVISPVGEDNDPDYMHVVMPLRA